MSTKLHETELPLPILGFRIKPCLKFWDYGKDETSAVLSKTFVSDDFSKV